MTKKGKVEAYQLQKNSMFYLHHWESYDTLCGPTAILKRGTTVEIVKRAKRYTSMLLRYVDRTGKTWWSWTHIL